jgi:hypothetical protein
MRTAAPRRFTLVDAMVLVAGVAVSFVLIREYVAYLDKRHVVETIPHDWSFATIWRFATLVSATLAPLAVSLCLGLWVLRLLKPRPDRIRLFRQPGMVACTATIIETSLLAFKVLLGEVYLRKRGMPLPELHGLWISRLPWNGEVVAVVWRVLWLSGSWRPEPSWIDRSGRVLGAYWITSGVLFHYRMPY